MTTRARVMKPTDSVIPTVTEVEMPADFLVTELEGNKLVDEKLKAMVKDFILTNREIDKEIEKIVDKIEQQKIKVFLTKLGFGVWSVAMIVLGAVLPVIIESIR